MRPFLSDRNGWTGGQYSLFRTALGTYLAAHYAALLPWTGELFSRDGILPDASASPLARIFPNVLAVLDAPAVPLAMASAAVLLAICLALGIRDRWAAVGLWYVGACFFGRNPLISNPSLPYIGWMLLAHACLPPDPFGSWAARRRTDPRGGWAFPQPLLVAAWVLLAVAYSYSGYTKIVSPSWQDGTAMARVLENPLARPTFLREAMLSLPQPLLKAATWGALSFELLFAPLACIPVLRPWLWGAMVGMHAGLVALIDFADLSLGMLFFHWFTFDPAWIPGRRDRGNGAPLVFYDGGCGLCHRFVRFLLSEDAGPEAVRFAPLESDAFRKAISEERRQGLPDSVVVRMPDGEILTCSRAILYLLRRLGGAWRILGEAGRFVPPSLLDAAYACVARARRRLFAPPSGACPLLPPDLRSRFLH